MEAFEQPQPRFVPHLSATLDKSHGTHSIYSQTRRTIVRTSSTLFPSLIPGSAVDFHVVNRTSLLASTHQPVPQTAQ
jgi:hypothetical protein